MGGSSIICPGADPDSVYIVEYRSFVAWFEATLDGQDRLSSPAPQLEKKRKTTQAAKSSSHPETLNCS